MKNAYFVRGNAASTEQMEAQVPVTLGKKSGYHGLHFTCGKNLAYQVKMDQVPYFFPVALLDAVSARTKIFPEAEQEKKYP